MAGECSMGVGRPWQVIEFTKLCGKDRPVPPGPAMATVTNVVQEPTCMRSSGIHFLVGTEVVVAGGLAQWQGPSDHRKSSPLGLCCVAEFCEEL